MTTEGLTQFNNDERAILQQLATDIAAEEGAPTGQTTDVTTATAVETPAPTPATAPAPAAAQAPAPAPTPAPTPAPAAATQEQQADTQPQGGDTRAALRAARHAERRAKAEADRLRKENEDLRAGKAPLSDQFTEQELADMERDFPTQAKLVRQNQALQQKVDSLTKPAEPEFIPSHYDNPAIQEAIDSVPTLLAWQYDPKAQDKFEAAIEEDKVLLADPVWKSKSLQERLVEVTRRVVEATTPKPQEQRLDPAAVIAGAPTTQPTQIADFRGGAAPTATTLDYSRMTDDQIMASLPRG